MWIIDIGFEIAICCERLAKPRKDIVIFTVKWVLFPRYFELKIPTINPTVIVDFEWFSSVFPDKHRDFTADKDGPLSHFFIQLYSYCWTQHRLCPSCDISSSRRGSFGMLRSADW
jgi:hypothetical protein